MTLHERIDADLKDAMRAKEAGKLSVLRGLKSALKYAEIEKADAGLDDSAAVQVIRKQVKQRQDSIESFENEATEVGIGRCTGLGVMRTSSNE